MTQEWLDTFLRSRELVKPDGRLLCDYGCRDDEYRSLIEILKRQGEPGGLRQTYRYGARVKSAEPDAEDWDLMMPAFVLYASEWFGREWRGEKRMFGSG